MGDKVDQRAGGQGLATRGRQFVRRKAAAGAARSPSRKSRSAVPISAAARTGAEGCTDRRLHDGHRG